MASKPKQLQAEVAILYEQMIAASYAGYIDQAWALPISVDEAESQFGVGIYRKMMNHPYVAGPVMQLCSNILSAPIENVPAFKAPLRDATPEEVARSEQAAEVCQFVCRAHDGLSWHSGRNMALVAFDMLRAIWQGASISEITLVREVRGVDKGRDVLKLIKPIRRENLRMVVDPHNNLLGVIALQPGLPIPFRSGPVGGSKATNYEEVQDLPGWIPRDKLLVFTLQGEGSPAGKPLLRPVYDAWTRIQKMRPVEFKTGVQFGGGIASVEVGENAKGGKVLDGKGGTAEVDALTYARRQAEQLMQSGSVAVFPEGYKLNLHRPTGLGDFFPGFFDAAQREIVVGILTSARTVMEAQRSSQADAGKAENLLDSIVSWFRLQLCIALTFGINRLLVEQNFGAEVARDYLPVVTMGGVRFEDILTNGTSLSAIGWKLAPNQAEWVDEKFGMPIGDRDSEAEMAADPAEQDQAEED